MTHCRLLFLLLLAALLPTIGRSQVASTYLFTASQGATLDPMTGATNQVATGDDDNPSSSVSIGFSFLYEGVAYTNLFVSPDGWLKLGGGGAVAQYTNDLSSTNNAPKIAPFWDDLTTGSNSGGGTVRTLLTGTAPNRLFKIEWFVTVPYDNGGTANTRFQVWLYENGGQIDFLYGGTPAGPTSSASIGLTSATAPAFLSITPGAMPLASNTYANNAIVNYPAMGTQYSFTPPPPCTGTPSGTIAYGPAQLCSGQSFTLNASGFAPASGLTYQWQSAPAGSGNWSSLAGANTLAYTLGQGQTNATDYRIVVGCNNGGADTSAALSVAMMPAYLCSYCKNNLGGDGFSSLIDSVGIAGTTLGNASPGSDMYTSYPDTGHTTAVLLLDSTYMLHADFGNGTTDAMMWIDYNHNGVFDTSEYTLLTANGTSANAALTIPDTALTGETGMRIRSRSTSILFTPQDACKTVYTGETEDYIVRLVSGQCDTPLHLSAANTTDTSALLGWDSVANAAGYNLVIDQDPGAPANTGTAVSGHTFTAGSLLPGTLYYLHVRTDCGYGIASGWTTLAFSTTLTPPSAVAITQAGAPDIAVFPNPVQDKLGVDLHQHVMNLELTDLSGKRLSYQEKATGRATMDLHGIAPGLYLLKCSGPEGINVFRIEKL